MSNNDNESFVRWQGRLIKQFGYVNNLLVGLATGLLAFETQLAFNDKAFLSCLEKWIIIPSIILIFLSLAIGCYLSRNRLKSFRITAQVARKREENEKESIEKLRNETERLDKITWHLIEWQFFLFATGSLFLFIVTCVRYLK